MQTTRLNRPWVIKTTIYLVCMLALGLWGLVDGLVVYPNRGKRAAEFLEMQYLEQSQRSGSLLTAAIDNPRDEYNRLRDIERQLEREADEASKSGRTVIADQKTTELARLRWLTQLARVGILSPARTQMRSTDGVPDPAKRLTELQQAWASRTQPKPLSSFDIPSQWVIAGVGFGAAGWILFVLIRASRKKYRYEPEAMRLTLPGGRVIEPKDIKEVDRRKWDKFFVFLHLKDSTPEIKLDLLRYSPLEAWILEMEKHTDGYVPPEEDEPQPEPAPAADATT
ncbi:MAG: hypothetical protein AB7G17_11445 [Phycisphaerales bacterium]